MRGRERILSHKKSYAHYQDVIHGSSTCANKSTVKEILNTVKAEKASKSGIVLLGKKAEVSRQTVDRYHKEVEIECVRNGEGAIVMTPKLQLDHRHAAENSLRSMVAFLMTVLTAHLVPKAQCFHHSFDKKHLERGPKKTIAMVEKCVGYEVVPLQPAHFTSADDTSLHTTNDTIEQYEWENGMNCQKKELKSNNTEIQKSLAKKAVPVIMASG